MRVELPGTTDGARAGIQQLGLDPLTAVGDVGIMQFSPQLHLRHAGTQCIAHALHADVADRERMTHAGDFLGALD